MSRYLFIPTPSIPSSTLLNGIQTYWKFDETSGITATDEISSYVINHNGAAITTGKINSGLDIQTGDYPTCTSNIPHTFSKTSPFTISLWYKPSGTGTRVLFDKQQTDSTRKGYECYISSTNIIMNFFGNTSSNWWNLRFTLGTLTIGSWYNFIFTYDGSVDPYGVKCYLNNSALPITVQNNNLGALDFNGTANFKFGVYNTNAFPILGVGDELASWNRELTGAERIELYNSGAGNQYPFA